MTFQERADAAQHVAANTPLEIVLKQYSWANTCQVLDVVVDNWKLLKEANLLEEAFLHAWSINKHGLPKWPMAECRWLFALLDPNKLRNAGDTLPAGEVFTVYRGVAGNGAKRRVRGFSWTGDEGIARHFAILREQGYGLPNPAVYRAGIHKRNVLAYINESGRNEQEFLVWPECLINVTKMR